MRAEPVLDDIGGAAFRDVDAAAGLGVDEDGRVDEAAAQREIVDPKQRGTARAGRGILGRTRSAVSREACARRRQQPRRGSARLIHGPAR